MMTRKDREEEEEEEEEDAKVESSQKIGVGEGMKERRKGEDI